MSTTIQQTDYPNDVTILEIPCPLCGKISKLKVSTKGLARRPYGL